MAKQLLVLTLILWTWDSLALDIPASCEAVIQGGTASDTDVDEAAVNYLHLKFNNALVYSRKVYFQFDTSILVIDTNSPAGLRLMFQANYKQRVQLWALKQAYPGFNDNITWNIAQANEKTSNNLLLTGPLTAVRIGPSILLPESGTQPVTLELPKLADVMISNQVFLVLTGADDAQNSPSGLRIQRRSTVLSVTMLSGYHPPVLSTVVAQNLRIGGPSATIPFTLSDDADDPTTLTPIAFSSDSDIVPLQNITFGGTGANRTVTVAPGTRTGSCTITIRVVDSQNQAGTTSFPVSVIEYPVIASEYDVYFASGQSNMDGRGSINDLTGPLSIWNRQQPDIRIYYANPINLDWANPDYDSGWCVFGPGFSVPPGFSGNLPSTRFGPELAFARTVADAHPDRTLAIIKVSQGGTSLGSDWKPGTGYMYRALTNMASVALRSLTNDGSSYILRGMIWHQGEGDGSSSTSTYQARLTEFIASVRNHFGVTNLPFVVGELATNRSLTVRQAQKNVAETVPYVGFASSSNLVTLAPDDPHFNSAGALIMGQRMAAALEIPQTKLLGAAINGQDIVLRCYGLARSQCRVLSTANLALPRSQWTSVATNRFDSVGVAGFAIPIEADAPARFFAVE